MRSRRSPLPALLTALTALAVFAPSALAGGTLSVSKAPAAGAATVTGTAPVRDFEGNEEGTRTVLDCGADCDEVVFD